MAPSNSNNNKQTKRRRSGSVKDTTPVSKATTTIKKTSEKRRNARTKDISSAKLRATKRNVSLSKDDEQFISSETRIEISSIVQKNSQLKSCNPSTILQAFEKELDLEYLDVEEIERIFNQHDNGTNDDSDDNDDKNNNQKQNLQQELEQLAVRYYIQTEKAKLVFQLFDKERRDFIVLDDLRDAADEILNSTGASNNNNNNKDFVGDDELHEMIQEFNPDGILTFSDFIRIARMINL